MTNNANKKHRESFTLNDKIALKITRWVGSMWCAYAFAALALTALPAALEGGIYTTTQWLSQTFIQLVMLSILMVSANLLSRHAEHIADATYEDAEEIKGYRKQLLEKINMG